MSNELMVPVTDIKTLRMAESLSMGIVDGSVHLKGDSLSARGWVAVPLESAAHLDGEFAASLSAAMEKMGCRSCLAIATEPLSPDMKCFRVDTTAKGLLEFDRRCSHFNFLLIPEDDAFAILCTTDDYLLVAGQQGFLARACGDISVARRRFLQYAQGNSRLLKMAARYEPEGESAE